MNRSLLVTGLLLAAVLALAIWLWTPDRPMERLEARYADGPEDFVELAGTRIHLRDSGPRDAPAVILLHGFGASLHTWEPWAEALADEFRVIRFDLPGGGLSGPDATGDYSDARSLQILTALMTQLGLARASLVGNSMGGRIAWRFAAEHPERVARLVLISPDGFASPGFEYGVAPKVPGWLGAMRYILPRSALRANLKVAYADPQTLTTEAVTRYHDLLRAPGNRQALLDRMSQVVLVPPEPLLRRIEAPVLLLWGELDGMIPVANAQDYLAALPDARLVSFDDLGHVPHEEAPARALVPVRDFLRAGD
ncbi:MAG: alpha/beta fold hydrolase [Gammaproteobacteria bacterium]|nr:alpha/beta fold hydrolase [Gammaproteobacteria bacterium]